MEQACAMFERVVSGRQAREQERREGEERAREEREQAFRDQQEREREVEERAARPGQDGDNGLGEDEQTTATVLAIDGQRRHVQESPQWLCDHYRRRCKVRFPCCNVYHPCHRQVLTCMNVCLGCVTSSPVLEHCQWFAE